MSLLKILLKENTESKIKPLICKGDFICSANNLQNLIGSPEKVGGDFGCVYNRNLTSLEGCPKEVSGDFWCYSNPKLPKEEIIKLKESGIVKGEIYSDYGDF
jgi:hypothetical protein